MQKLQWKYAIKCIFGVIAFFSIFVTIFIWVSYLLRPAPTNLKGLQVLGYYAEPKDTIDAVYIGGSACYIYWMPLQAWNEYGFTSMDFAGDTIPAPIIKYCSIEVQKLQSPKVLIIDARPFQYGWNGSAKNEGAREDEYIYSDAPIRNFSDRMNYSLNRFQMINNSISEDSNVLEYQLDIIKYHSNWNKLSYPKLVGSFKGWPDRLKGSSPIGQHAVVDLKDFSGVTEKLPIDPDVEFLLTDLCEYLQTQDMKVLFIIHAYCASKEQKMQFNYIDDVVTGFGFDFLNTCDYMDEMGLDPSTDFYNSRHVNSFGAEKYTRFVSKYLMEHYGEELADKRGLPEYESWNRDYTLFLEDVEKANATITELIQKANEAKEVD